MKLPSEHLEVNWDSNSQSGSSFGSVKVYSLTLSYTPRSMKCDSRAYSWPAPLQALALVTCPRLGLQHATYPFPNMVSTRIVTTK